MGTLPKQIRIHWFRRDLKIGGNKALQYLSSLKDHKNILTVFFFDSKFLSREDFSVRRFDFFIKTLQSLKKDLQSIGSDLLVLDMQPDAGFDKLIAWFKNNSIQLEQVTFNRDYEPFARKRDEKVSDFLKSKQIEVHTFKDHLILEPHEVFKLQSGDYYQVYTPFSKYWMDIVLSNKKLLENLDHEKRGLDFGRNAEKKKIFEINWNVFKSESNFNFDDKLDDFYQQNKTKLDIQTPDGGVANALKRLNDFKSQIDSYESQRDFPDVDGTSKMSLYLKNGSVTSAQIICDLDLLKKQTRQKYLKEIIWREFYYHILYHRPEVETQAFQVKYNDLKFENRQDWFEKWKNGETGFPIVDAGMRQLNQTGWMHNRVRMIVSSFLIKDLLIDWRWGENYFMHKLLDGDLAPNNGGWQWAASTGCDAQPYFRVFNPWLQSEKFDADAKYIKEFIPELRSCSVKNIHDPEGERPGYAKPMVDHQRQKVKAIQLYKIS